MFSKKIAMITASLLFFTMCNKDQDKTVREIKTKSGIVMVFLPAGEFMMGGDRAGETPVHRVYVSAFYIDKFEVTQEMYNKYDLPNPSHFKGEKRPVDRISWINAAVYCNERSSREGFDPCYDDDTMECNYSANGYRLPTEAEWEYAARAGSSGKFFFGNQDEIGNYSVYSKNNPGGTAIVGTKKPNSWGLFDMYGNVAEWCNDYYSTKYYSKSTDSNPKGPSEGNERVIRGGSWNDPETLLYSGSRGFDASLGFFEASSEESSILRDTIGFRCVRKADR